MLPIFAPYSLRHPVQSFDHAKGVSGSPPGIASFAASGVEGAGHRLDQRGQASEVVRWEAAARGLHPSGVCVGGFLPAAAGNPARPTASGRQVLVLWRPRGRVEGRRLRLGGAPSPQQGDRAGERRVLCLRAVQAAAAEVGKGRAGPSTP